MNKNLEKMLNRIKNFKRSNKILTLSLLVIITMFVTYSLYLIRGPNVPTSGGYSCASKDYTSNRKVKFSFGEIDYLAVNQGNLLGIYKFPEFDIFAYKKSLFSKNDLFSVQVNALSISCQDPKTTEGGDYSLVENDPNKRIDVNLLNLVSTKNFYVYDDDFLSRPYYSSTAKKNLETKTVSLQNGFIASPGDSKIQLLDKQTGYFNSFPSKDKIKTGRGIIDSDIDWSKLIFENSKYLGEIKQEMVENFEYKYKEIIDAGCVYTDYRCQAESGPPTFESKTKISDKGKELRFLTGQVGYPGAEQLKNQPAQRILDLNNPNELKMTINLVFNYQQKTGQFIQKQNDCKDHKHDEEFYKLPTTECKDRYEMPKYKPSGKFKLVQIVINSTDRGKSWFASDLKTKEYTIQKEFTDSSDGSNFFSSDFIPKGLSQDISYPEEFSTDSDVSTKYNVDNYPYQIKIWRE